MKKLTLVIAIVGILIGISLVSYYLFYLIINPNSVTPLALGALGYMASKFYENHKERQARLYDKKRDVYQNLLAPYRGVLLDSISKKEEDNKEAVLTNDQIAGAVNAAFDAVMFGSDSVLKAYGEFRNVTIQHENDATIHLKRLANFLQAIRKDLGNDFSSIDEVGILKMFINMDNEQEELLRTKFKAYK